MPTPNHNQSTNQTWLVSCWLVSIYFPFLLSQCAIRTLVCLNEHFWLFLCFESTIICISASLAVISAAHVHSHSLVCVPCLLSTLQSWKMRATLRLLLLLWKGSSHLSCSWPPRSSLISGSHIGQCGASCFFRPLHLNGAGSLAASVVQISGHCSLLYLNDTNLISLVALSSDISLNSSCLWLPDVLLADEFSSTVSYTIGSASSSEESKGVTVTGGIILPMHRANIFHMAWYSVNTHTLSVGYRLLSLYSCQIVLCIFHADSLSRQYLPQCKG